MTATQEAQSCVINPLPDIEAKWKEYKAKRVKQYPQNNLRASSIGNPCERYHYHSIHDWREKVLHDELLQSIFDEGNLHEKDVMRQLNEMGFEIVEQQRAFQLDKPLVTGHIDGILRWHGQDYPFDVKTISPYEFDRIDAIEDLILSKKLYQRNYPAQLQIYMLMTNCEYGFLLFKNKLTGAIKTIWAQIDFDYCDQLLKRAERVYTALQACTPPDRCNSFDVCKDCPYAHLCLPDIKMGEGVIPIDDMELQALLERREQLEAAAKEFKAIDSDIKGAVTVGGVGEKICGPFLVRVTEHERKNKVADTWHEEISTYFKTQILKLEG